MRVGFVSLDGSGATQHYLDYLVDQMEQRPDINPVVITESVRRYEVDILHFNFLPIHPDPRRPNSLVQLLSDTPSVATTHGNVHYTEPSLNDYSSKLKETYRKVAEPIVAESFDALIAASDNSACHLISNLEYPESDYYTVNHGVDHSVFSPRPDSRSELSKTYGINTEYILHVSNYSQRKNPDVLIDAFLNTKADHDMDLVIVGSRWENENIVTDDRINIVGRVPQDDLDLFYSNSEFFFFPTLHEGFGLPNLEAMACGAPVLTSNAYAVPEVVGDAAIQCDPNETEQFENEIIRLSQSPDLKAELSEKGLERAASFSWEKAAEETIEVYEQVLSEY